jgi:hypothetical protein
MDTTTWAFVEGESKLKIENDTFTIEQLDGSTLVVSYTETVGGITSYTKVTLGH